MSLYSDNAPDQDPYQALTVALGKPAESKEQVEALLVVSDLLEARPAGVTEFCLPLLEAIKHTGDTALKRWVLSSIAFGLGRSSLTMEVKTTIASTALSDMVQLLQDPSPAIVKLAVQSLSCMYPLLFRSLCITRPPREDQWQLLTAAKTQILSFALAISIDPATLGQPKDVNVGVRSLAWKFIQRSLLVATRGGSADPRLQSQNKDDPNLNLVPSMHPFIKATDLMNETNQLLAQISQALATSSETAVLQPILNLIPPLLKARPALATTIIPSLTGWTPAAMQTAGRSASQIRSMEKALRITMVHLLRTGMFPAFGAQLNDAVMIKQVARTSAALKAEKAVRYEAAARRVQATASSTTVKREHDQLGGAASDNQPLAAKRQKVEANETNLPVGKPGEGLGPDIDVTTLGFDVMLELLFVRLNAMDENAIRHAIEQSRHSLRGTDAPHHLALARSLGASSSMPAQPSAQVAPAPVQDTTLALPSRLQEDEPDDMLLDPLDEDSAIPSAAVMSADRNIGVKLEEGPAQDPLNMVVEDEEPEDVPEVVIPDELPAADGAVEEALPMRFIDFSLPEVESLDERGRQEMVLQIMRRICKTGGDVQQQMAEESDFRMLDEDSEAIQGLAGPMISPKEMWVLLLARMASRSHESQTPVKGESGGDSNMSDDDWVRKALCEYVMEDFASRSKLARVWLNEEWYSEQISPPEPTVGSSYAKWLKVLLSRYLEKIEDGDSSDNSLSSFLIDLPAVPKEILEILRGLCEQTQSAAIGLSTLRDIVTLRPPLRQAAMGLLLDMTTHPDRKIRLIAINTAKRWVPDSKAMSDMVLEFAKTTFARLKRQSDTGEMKTDADEQSYTYLPQALPQPASQELVQQYVELLFALSVREPSLLVEIFTTYPQCEQSVQDALRAISTPLIRSLGSRHVKLLESLRNFPPEAEAFALHVVNVFTDTVRPSPALATVIKELAEERELSPQFLIPIASQMDRTELYRFLPKILGILSESPAEKRETIRTVFRNIIPISDIRASTNLPKGKPEELSAADLLVLLHEDEKAIGVSAAKEAIDICFTLTDRFPSEVMAVVMQRIIDSVNLPILFMRTVIRSVQTYKSLVGYVSTTLLSRLITKKIWTYPQLWVGFMHCVKAIAPASFGALMQLPREQLKELIDKQPSIKPALYQYVVQKAGVAKAQSLADLFGNTPQAAPAVQQPITTAT